MRQATLVKFFNAYDDKSVEFSEDPNMYEKLGMKKPKRGEEKPYDIEKVYQFQLEKDLAKIRQARGPYKERNDLYTQLRHEDPLYHEIAKTAPLGQDGDFNALLPYTKDESWKQTSKPYGEIAHKRYLEYLANLPKGPTDEEIKDKEQRQKDKDLWKKVM